MAQESKYFRGVVTDADRAQNRAGAPDYGVQGESDFKVSTQPAIPYIVVVAKGKAHVHGVTDTAVDNENVQCGTLASGIRRDLIVVRRNWGPVGGGKSTLVAIPGAAFTDIPAGRKKTPGVEDDQPIVFVCWKGGQNAPFQITDLRTFAANGGIQILSEISFEHLAKPGTAPRF